MMRTLIRSSTVSRTAGAVAALWLCGGGVAWAGDGEDLGSLQALLSNGSTGICDVFNISPCPIPQTITQAVLEVAALGNNLLEMVRAQNNIPPGSSVSAGNPAAKLTALPDPTSVSEVLSTLTPLAFNSLSAATIKATQLYDPNKDTFVYAVGVSGFTGPTGLTDPGMAFFLYEDTFRTQNFSTGQVVAKFSFPLTVLNNDGTERAVPTTLQFTATKAGDCSASTVIGDFKGNKNSQTLLASTIGINCAVVFSTSPTSSLSHAIFEVAVPLLVTGACSPTACPPGPNTDPLYFYSLHTGATNPVNSGVFTAFLFDDPGDAPSKSSILGTNGTSIGLAPSAAPLALPASGTPNFALCASLPSNSGTLRPVVGAYYAMATSGEMLLSAPLPSAFTSGGTPPVCPSL